MNNIIEIKKLTKKYPNFTLGPIDLNIKEGEIIGLIGENGAGKTTLIKSILNILHPEYQTLKVFNQDFSTNEDAIKEDIGIVLDNAFFPDSLTALDINNIMKGVYQNWDAKLFQDYLKQFSLPKDKKIKELSKGMLKKLEIATSLAHKPKLLILDEPTSGLDPVVRSEVLDIFLNFIQEEDHTIILSTHITSDLEQIADEIIFINDGEIILNEKRDDIFDNYGILKCTIDEFDSINKEDIITYKKNKYNYEILVNNRDKIKKKYKNYVIDKITLEELMVLMLKGEKVC